jgi:glycine/D-amino acid oxidase-like deaminating enzyme
LRPFLFCLVLAVGPILAAQVIAQELVDPKAVAPEYREAAEKRRAEQIRQQDCVHKADAEKVLPRDRPAFIVHCLGTAEPE